MRRTLTRLMRELFGTALDFRVVIAEVLFMLVMIEVVRLLIVYLVDFMMELGIVATLREMVLRVSPSWTGSG